MLKRLLPFIPPSLRVVAVTAEPEHVMVLAVPRSTEPCCPACSNRSHNVHGTYERHLADLSIHRPAHRPGRAGPSRATAAHDRY